MKAPPVIVIDFETAAIQLRPKYPPVPCGVSIQWPKDRRAKYFAWGHASKNNSDKRTAERALKEAWSSELPLLFHNAKFDVDVAESHLGCRPLPWERVHDTMFLLFLLYPHARDLQLKPSAERILGMPPDERDAVKDWLIDNGVLTRQKANAREGGWGEHIPDAPGDVVGDYANGDCLRTLKLFQKCYPEVIERGMGAAYDRERRLLPILLDSERQGIRVDAQRLRCDIPLHEAQLEKADRWLQKRLKSPNLNVDADKEFGDALEKNGIVTDWVLTKTGQRSVSKKNLLPSLFKDKRVAQVYGYRNRLATSLRMFEISWLAQAEETGGFLLPSLNQVRQPKGSATKGTRTGRMSCDNPNLFNLTKDWYDKGDGYEHPTFLGVDELPMVRRYVLPDKDGVFCHRDYASQELRILAHFEDGALMQAYLENPFMDVHNFVRDLVANITGHVFERRHIKTQNFGSIYGRGIGSTAEALSCSYDEAKKLKAAHSKALPGIRIINDDIKDLVKQGLPIRTWGGREYFVEEPMLINGRMVDFTYKLINTLVQGSAADATKEAIIRYIETKKDSRFLVTVYDEIDITAPRAAVKQEMKILREAMESVEFDVPLLSDGMIGPNWNDLKKFDELKFDVFRWSKDHVAA